MIASGSYQNILLLEVGNLLERNSRNADSDPLVNKRVSHVPYDGSQAFLTAWPKKTWHMPLSMPLGYIWGDPRACTRVERFSLCISVLIVAAETIIFTKRQLSQF